MAHVTGKGCVWAWSVEGNGKRRYVCPYLPTKNVVRYGYPMLLLRAEQWQEFSLTLVVLLYLAGEDVVVPAVDFDLMGGKGSGD